MSPDRPYFFCGIGGSGMLPLALILSAKGYAVSGSDRALDQGRTNAKFDFLRARGIALYPQDGSGVTRAEQVLVVSAAIEETVPDVKRARELGAGLMTRAELLSDLFNAAKLSVGVAGTSGKSTTTAMIAWILHQAGLGPTVMNGAVMKNFVTPDALFTSAIVGAGDAFVSEVDESDGSIVRYRPRVAIVNNIALDHKSMDELRTLFRAFAGKAEVAVMNLDNGESLPLIEALARDKVRTFSLANGDADLRATGLAPAPDGIVFTARTRDGPGHEVRLQTPGAHNVANALAALLGAEACGVTIARGAEALASFKGVKRRLELVGVANDVTVIDDFAHNPDKIAATLSTLHAFPGRLLLMFQPQGYGPLKLMRNEFIACFAENMGEDDVLIMPDPAYFGGTVSREVTSEHIAAAVRGKGREALAYAERAACGDKLVELAERGDRIVIMGARDDTLSTFAVDVLNRVGAR